MSAYLLSLHWPGCTRSFVVNSKFDLGSQPSAIAWVPSDVLSVAGLPSDPVRVEVTDDAGTLGLVIGGVRHAADWMGGKLTLSVARVPEDLREVGKEGLLKGDSVSMRRLGRDIRLAASSDASVLIQGETGTGKELIARTLHESSARRDKKYVVVDCTAISETLFESELFGHVKGSFSGATSNRIGPFEEADGGTILLDEIGEIPLAMQPKLLRVLESGTIRRVGENTHRKVDVRVIGATHRDLYQLVQEGKFRGDLYYRLAVLEVRSPPLRERHGDLRTLLRSFVDDALFAKLTEDQWEAVETHPWRGNVRELRNFAEKAHTHGWDALFKSEAFPQSRETRASEPPASVPPMRGAQTGAIDTRPARENGPRDGETLASFRARWNHEGEAKYLRALLKSTSGSVTRAARIADVDRSHLHRILRRHGYARVAKDEGGDPL